MKVLVVGSGGREHALCWAISKSPKCGRLYAAPGNPGMAQVAECVDIGANDLDGIVAFAKNENIDFVVVGPESPLVNGLVDMLEEAGIKAFGPNQRAAILEGSKGFMKDLCARFAIPTAEYRRFDEPDAAKEYIYLHKAPLVIKADGLAAGKGVIICHNENEAHAAIDHIMTELAFGEAAGSEVVIEEFLVGEEASFFALVDGKTALPLVTAQDHKAAFDGGEGPNTGGMGAYTPAPVIDDDMAKRIMDEIITPTVEGMIAEGRPFKGVLYAGLMITEDGPKLIEHNVRFGDPECQAMMMRLKSDMLEALLACVEGRLDKIKLEWHDEAALTVVMASNGYPGHYENGSIIRNIDKAEALEDVMVFHAGTRRDNGHLTANGGRVLGITALGVDVKKAKDKAYKAVQKVDWPDGFFRNDIGWRATD